MTDTITDPMVALQHLDFPAPCVMADCSRVARNVLKHPDRQAHPVCAECADLIRQAVNLAIINAQDCYCALCNTIGINARTIHIIKL